MRPERTTITSETIKYIMSKWLKINRDDPTFQLYSRREKLSIINEILMYNNRANSGNLYEGHPGQTRMTTLPRSYFYWSNFDMDIVKFERLCENRQLASENPIKIPPQPRPRPDRPWKRIHANFARSLRKILFDRGGFILEFARSQASEENHNHIDH